MEPSSIAISSKFVMVRDIFSLVRILALTATCSSLLDLGMIMAPVDITQLSTTEDTELLCSAAMLCSKSLWKTGFPLRHWLPRELQVIKNPSIHYIMHTLVSHTNMFMYNV